jgi:hypothetical protein
MTPPPANPAFGFYPPPYGPAPAQAPKPSWRGRLVVLFTCLAFFLTACACPALVFKNTNGSTEAMYGFSVLVVGWLGILVGQVAWYANFVIGLSLIFLLFRRWLTAALLALVAVAIAADTLLLFSKEIPADEGGVNKMYLVHIGPGFYFWVASMLVVVVGAIILRLRGRAGAGQLVG